jgi:hypothetical protein
MNYIYDAAKFFKKERQRQNIGMIAAQKISEKRMGILYCEEANAEFNKFLTVSGTFIVVNTAGSFYFFKRNTYKFFSLIIGASVVFGWIWPYYIANIIDIIAETPTEYGQTIRAVLIFKSPSAAKTHHYEELSENFRKYQFKKNKMINSSD